MKVTTVKPKPGSVTNPTFDLTGLSKGKLLCIVAALEKHGTTLAKEIAHVIRSSP